jgi:hypothetical protein
MTALADPLTAKHRRGSYHGPGGAGTGPVTVSGPAVMADRSGTVRDRARTVRSWPLLLLAFPAAAEVWSAWVGIAEKTGFGLVSPLPGIWSSLHPGHDHHSPDRRRGVRGLRAARLAGDRPLDQPPDPAVRQVVRDLLECYLELSRQPGL